MVTVGEVLEDAVDVVDTLVHGEELGETVVDRVNEADELVLEHTVIDGERVPVVLDVDETVLHAETLDVVDVEADAVSVKLTDRDVHPVAEVECDELALCDDEIVGEPDEEGVTLGDAVNDREIVAQGDAEFDRVPDAVTETVADTFQLDVAGALIVKLTTVPVASIVRVGGAIDGETVTEPETETVPQELGEEDEVTDGD